MQLIRQDVRSGSHCNCFKYNSAYTDKHEDMKYVIFKELRRRKCDTWCEIIFTNGCRADLLTFNPRSGRSLIIEILYYEEFKDAKRKTEKYPKDIDKIYISADAPFNPDDLDI